MTAISFFDIGSPMIQNTPPQYGPLPPYHTVPTQMDCLADDIARQMAFSKLTRRGSRHSAITPVKSRVNAGGAPVRIAKGRSAGNSPRTLERRKTTIDNSRRRPTLSDHFEYMFGMVDGYEEEGRSMRPTSWHPSSQQQQYQHQHPHQQQQPAWPTSRPTSAQFSFDDHSIYNNTSFPAPSLYSYSSGISPISSPSPSILPFESSEVKVFNDEWLPPTEAETAFRQYIPLKPSRLSHALALQISSGFSCDDSHCWPYPPTTLPAAATATSPISPNFLPIQQPDYLPHTTPQYLDDDDAAEGKPEQEEGKELVGMGLYDRPCTSTLTLPRRPHSSNNLMTHHPFDFSEASSSSGQGLKLEETWQPPEASDSDDNADSDGGEDEEDNAEEEARPSHPEYTRSMPVDLSSTSFLLSADGFLDDEAAARITEPNKAQDAGLEHYGWI